MHNISLYKGTKMEGFHKRAYMWQSSRIIDYHDPKHILCVVPENQGHILSVFTLTTKFTQEHSHSLVERTKSKNMDTCKYATFPMNA